VVSHGFVFYKNNKKNGETLK